MKLCPLIGSRNFQYLDTIVKGIPCWDGIYWEGDVPKGKLSDKLRIQFSAPAGYPNEIVLYERDTRSLIVELGIGYDEFTPHSLEGCPLIALYQENSLVGIRLSKKSYSPSRS